MPERETPKIPGSENLQTEALRLTAFLRNAEHPDRANWWGTIFGSEPDTRNERPGLHQVHETGVMGDCSVALSSQLNRVDLVLTSPPKEDLSPPKWAGSLLTTMRPFEEFSSRWLTSGRETTRLALGLTAHIPMPGKLEAYMELAKYLPTIKLDPEHSSDFAYQINRPRLSKVIESLHINRLSKWSAALFTPVQFSIADPRKPEAVPLGEGRFSCRIELDINTSADWSDVLPNEQLVPLFMELSEMALEITRLGDIA